MTHDAAPDAGSKTASAGAARWWRTLAPLHPRSHGARLLHESRQRAWGPLLPTLARAWAQRGGDQVSQARHDALLALGEALDAAPAPPTAELLAGRLWAAGREVAAFPPADWALPGAQPWETCEAHSLHWVEALAAVAAWGADLDASTRACALAEAALTAWHHAALRLPGAWEPWVRARRTLATLRGAARLVAAHAHAGDRTRGLGRGLRDALLATAAAAAADLEWMLETHLDGNHLLTDHIALAAAEAVFRSGDGHLRAAVAEAERQFPGDGGHVEATPMYHAMLLDDLLTLRALRRDHGPAVARLQAVLVRATAWLATVRHPDGRLPCFGDTDPDAMPAFVLAHAAVTPTRPLGPEQQRSVWAARQGPHFAVCHVAPALWEPQPGHAHADHLDVEWSWQDRRIVSGAGLAGYDGDPRRALNRSAASHSVVDVPGRPALELWATFRVGARGRVAVVERGRSDGWQWVTALAFWPGVPSLAHLRLVALHTSGALAVADRLDAGAAPPVSGMGRLRLAPGVRCTGARHLDTPAGPLQADATTELEVAPGVRFPRRAETEASVELRYRVVSSAPVWVVLGARGMPTLAHAQAALDGPWQGLVAGARR